MRRSLAVLGLLACLVALAGCSTLLGPGEPDQAQLDENASYDWENDATVSISVNRSSFTAVYDVSNRSEDVDNESTLELYRRDELGQEHNLRVSALRYRYANGTVIDSNGTALSVDRTRERTIVVLPNNGTGGQVAFTADRHGKQFATPVFVEGSYDVRLPSNARVGIPFLSQVSPGGYETNVSDGRMTVSWDEVTSRSLRVRWYLERDLFLFTGVVAAAVVFGSGGALYYYRQIRRLKRRRDEVGLDVEDEEDDDPRDRGPPPGMR